MIKIDRAVVFDGNAGKSNLRGVAQLGSALGSGPRGRKFKSCFPD